MYFNGKRVTLESINTIFRGYSLDIQDEVRSMVLDNIDLSKWIDVCRENPYRLNQIRLGSKEGLSPDFFSIDNGEVIYSIRRLASTGFDISELIPYLGKGFSKEQWRYIVSWAENGLLDSRLALVRTPTKMWKYIDKGLRNNLPMWLFTSGKSYSDLFMHSVITLMSNGEKPEKYLNGNWQESTLRLLAEFSYRRWFGSIVDLVDYFIPYDFLVALGEIAKSGKVDHDFLVQAKDSVSGESYYLYQSYHLEAYGECVSRGYNFSDLKDPDLSYEDVEVLMNKKYLESKRSFKGRL